MSGIGSWLGTSRANKFFDTYVKGFVDVSGGYLQLRQGNLYMNDGDISLNGKLYATGAATLASTLNVTGDVTVGGDIVPSGNITQDLGSTSKRFNNIFGKTLHIDNNSIVFDTEILGQTQTTTLSIAGTEVAVKSEGVQNVDSSFILMTNNQVGINKQSLLADTTLDVAGTAAVSGDVSLNADLYVAGDVSLNGGLTMDGAAVLSSTLIVAEAATMSNTLTVTEAATMSSTLAVTKEATLSDVLKVTGDVSMNAKLYVADKLKIGENSDAAVALDICANDAIMIPRGTNNQRPVATNGTGTSGDAVYKGYVRYNTETEQFEGFGAGNAWGSLGGVKDVDQDTYILAESSAGADNDELQFYTVNTERMRIGANGDLSLNTNAAIIGKMALGDDFTSTIALDISASDALRIPVGTEAQRPGTGATGMIRYNTDNSQFEGYSNNNNWVGLGGVIDVDQNTYIIAETSPGANNNELQFYTDGSERMRITEDGDLSLNTGTKLIVMSDSSMNGRLDVGGDVSLNGDLTIEGNLNVLQQQNTSVINTTVNNYEVIISNDLSVNGEVKAIGDASFGGNLFIGGTTNLEGDVSMGTSLNVNGTAAITGAVDITGATTVTGATNITGATAISGDLTLTGAATVSSTLDVTGATTLSDTLDVTKATTLSSTLDVTGVTKITGATNITGATAISGDLTLTGAATVSSTLDVTGDVNMGGRVDVAGDVSLNGDLTIEGNLNVLQQQNTSVINTTVNNYEVIISNDLSVNGEVKAIGDASFGGNLFIGGTSNLVGEATLDNNLIVGGTAAITGAVDITGATTITGDVSLNSKLYVQDDVSFNAEVYVGGNLTVNESLAVGGSFQVEDMSVNGYLSVRGGIDASGASVYAESFQFGVVDQFDIEVDYQANFPITNEYITFTQGFHVIGDVSMNGRTLQF